MIEHLPPGSPWEREVRGAFNDELRLLREIESRMRDVQVVGAAILGALKAGLRLRGSDRLPTPKYIPVPGPAWESDEVAEVRAQERDELAALINRNRN